MAGNIKRLILLDDEPVLEDRLKREKLVEEIGNAAAHCRPPQVFGLNGDWGAGKTSLLRQLQYHLAGPPEANKKLNIKTNLESGAYQKETFVVWFDAWRYQNEDSPIVALLQEIRAQWSRFTKIWQSTKKLATIATQALLTIDSIMKVIGLSSGTSEKVQSLGEKWERQHLAEALPANVIREQLEHALEQLLGGLRAIKPGLLPRIVVLIDDLDRCRPEMAFRLLEGLRLYLSIKNCVVVMAVNFDMIKEAVGSQLAGDKRKPAEPDKFDKPKTTAVTPGPESPSLNIRATAYLEKVCQHVWHMPLVTAQNQLLIDLLKHANENTKNLRDWIQGVITGCDRLRDTDEQHLKFLPPNPRRVKSLTNRILLFDPWFNPKQGETDFSDLPQMVLQTQLMLIVAYVYEFHFELFQHWREFPNYYKTIRVWCRTAVQTETPSGPLGELARPYRIQTSTASQATMPGVMEPWQYESMLLNPGRREIFWMQVLVHQLPEEVKPLHFLPFLRDDGDLMRKVSL